MHLRDLLFDHEYRSGWAIGLFLLLFLAYRYSRLAKAIFRSQRLFWLIAGAGLIVTLTYGLSIILYLFYPNYIDHYEATVSAIAWQATHSHPIYPDWQTGDIYAAPYGPLLFVTIGTVLQLLPTILGSKLAGSTAFLVALASTYVSFNFRAIKKADAIFVLWLIVIATFSFFHLAHAFWTRAEPFLILISVLTVIAAVKLPPATAATTIGLLGGVALNFKLHGALYALPAALSVCGGKETWKDRIRLATLSSVAGGFAAIIPFLARIGNIEGYTSIILMDARHGLAVMALITNVLFAMMLLTPIILVWYFRRPRLSDFDTWFLSGLFMALVVTTIVASKPGAGPHHFLPLVPISAFGLLSVLEAPTSRPSLAINTRDVGILVLIPLLIFYAPGELRWTKRFGNNYLTAQSDERRKIDELQAFSSRYPAAEMGLSDDEHYSDTYYKVLLVFDGAPLHVDFDVWMDLSYAGVSETRIIGMLEHCDIPVWLVPEGLPFTGKNYYTDLPLLSDDFRRTFSVRYRLIDKGHFYSVWKC